MNGKVFTWSKLIQVFKLVRLDIFVTLYLFAFKLSNVPRNQLIQDKYCINTIGLDRSKCLQLELLGPEYDDIRNRVYVYSTTLTNYDAIISAPFGVITSLLAGYWIDQYPDHLKYLLATPAFGGIFCALVDLLNAVYFDANTYHVLWRSVFYALSGTMSMSLTGAYAYVIQRTKSQYRVARFATFEMFLSIAQLSSFAVGGKLLTVTSFLAIDQQRNFRLPFLTSLITYAIAFLWVPVFLCDTVERPAGQKDSTIATVEPKEEEKSDPKHLIAVLAQVFRLSTIMNMTKAVFRRRPQKRRAVLLNLTFGMTICLLGYLSESVIGLQFAQKVYRWNSSYYSYMFALMTIIPALINALLPVILSRKLLVFDSTLCIIGSISMILSLAIRGGILESYGYYISCLIGIFSGLLLIVKRSILSRIIEQNEVGQIFSLLACIESLIPTFLSVFYTMIFNATIQNAPGTAHQVVSLLMFYPYILSLWLGLNVYKWDPVAAKSIEERKRNDLNLSKL